MRAATATNCWPCCWVLKLKPATGLGVCCCCLPPRLIVSNHLRNQLDLFGFARQVALPPGNDCVSEEAQAVLSRLIVRRLNAIDLCGKRHTRNMYRREHRTGEAAEVQMSIEQQLFAALLQKKVSEYLRENCAGRFELGMLASFESYLPGEKNKAIEFDGQDDHASDGSKRDAQDRHVVESLIDDFNQEFKTTPPHPKMDWVAEQAHRLSFEQGKKQLIFVRRVRSVSELKFKLERAYDHWVGDYIRADAAVAFWFDKYNAQVRERSQALKEDVAADGDVEATGRISSPGSTEEKMWSWRVPRSSCSSCPLTSGIPWVRPATCLRPIGRLYRECLTWQSARLIGGDGFEEWEA